MVRSLYACLAAIVIMAVVQPARSVLGRALSLRSLCWVGLISYGLYLWHSPVNTFVTPGRFSLDGTALNALRLVVTFALATASYYLVERPVRRRVRIASLTRVWAPVAVAVCGIVLVAATASASPPPNYLGGSGFLNGLSCSPAGADQQAEAGRAAAKLGFLPLDAPTMPSRILVVGDSEACSLMIGLRAFGTPRGISFTDASVIGCGAAAGQLYSSTEDFPSGTELCRGRVRGLMTAGVAEPTDAIIWLSNWERDDQVVHGRLVRFGTDEGRRLVLAQMEKAYRTLRAHTAAPLVLLTVAAPSTADQVDGRRPGLRVDDRRYPRLNHVLEKFAAEHPRRRRDRPGAPVVPEGSAVRIGARLQSALGRRSPPHHGRLGVGGQVAVAEARLTAPPGQVAQPDQASEPRAIACEQSAPNTTGRTPDQPNSPTAPPLRAQFASQALRIACRMCAPARTRSCDTCDDEPMTTAGSVVRAYTDAWLAGDLMTVLDLYHDDLILHYGGSNPLTGDHHGKDAALTALLTVQEKTQRVPSKSSTCWRTTITRRHGFANDGSSMANRPSSCDC